MEKEKPKKNWVGKLKLFSLMAILLAQSFKAQAGTFEGASESKKTGSEKEVRVSGEEDTYGSDTYIMTEKDFERETMVDLSNYFEIDKANIGVENIVEIKNEFNQFLQSVNSENIDQILASECVIYGSSDERPTNAWKGGNLELTQARLGAVNTILQTELAEQTFQNSGLTAEQISDLKHIDFKLESALYSNIEQGVTPLTQLTNKKTGELYTENEIAQLTFAEKEVLYQEARKVCFFLRVVDSKKFFQAQEKRETMITNDTLPETEIYKFLTTNLFDKYKKCAFAIDNSFSMTDSKNLLSQSFVEAKDKIPEYLAVSTFSDHLDGLVQTKSPETTLAKAFTGKGSSSERVGTTAMQMLQQMETANSHMSPELSAEKGAVVIVTDESIQDMTYTLLQNLKQKSLESNCDIYVVLISDKQKEAVLISLDELERAFMNAFSEKITPLEKKISEVETKISTISNNKERNEQEAYLQRLKDLRIKLNDRVTPINSYATPVGDIAMNVQ